VIRLECEFSYRGSEAAKAVGQQVEFFRKIALSSVGCFKALKRGDFFEILAHGDTKNEDDSAIVAEAAGGFEPAKSIRS
jgi:hypothetical protein